MPDCLLRCLLPLDRPSFDPIREALHRELATADLASCIGTFAAHLRPPLTGRNPMTGQQIQIAPKASVYFCPSPALQAATFGPRAFADTDELLAAFLAERGEAARPTRPLDAVVLYAPLRAALRLLAPAPPLGTTREAVEIPGIGGFSIAWRRRIDGEELFGQVILRPAEALTDAVEDATA